MQMFSLGDNLHEMSKAIFWESKKNIISLSSEEFAHRVLRLRPSPVEPGYSLPLQTVYIQISCR